MSERGHFLVPRNIFGEALLRDPVVFRAWLWLLAEAAWADREQEVPNGRSQVAIRLKRGQLTHSFRYVAKAWGVSVKRARTILDHLEVAGWITLSRARQGSKTAPQTGTPTGTLQTIITICNYDRLQTHQGGRGTHKGTQTGTLAPQKRHRTNYKTIEEREIEVRKPEQRPEDYTDADWQARLQHLDEHGEWSTHFGPRPGEPGCLVPSHLLVKPVRKPRASRAR
jgi:hypothetical protein